ncbi:MAG: S-layer homology domain-containing protein, partial [Clostridia bacterium]
AEEIFAFLFGDKDPADFTDEEKQEAVDFANSLYFALKIRVVGDVTAEDADAISGNDIAEETGLITALEEELANWKKVEKMTDVTDKDAWYYEPISFVMAYDIFLGTTETTFSPDLGMTRAMFVTVLGRICGVDDNYEAENTDYVFGDVDPDQYYAAYVAWAAENGITNGTGKNTFSPNAEIKRQDLVTMMARFSDYVGYELPEASAELFEDDADICDYAREAVYQFKDLNIIEGKGDNVFDPNGFTTRAETAKILYLFLND